MARIILINGDGRITKRFKDLSAMEREVPQALAEQ